MAGIPSGRVSSFNYGMVPGYDAGTPDVSPAYAVGNGLYGVGAVVNRGLVAPMVNSFSELGSQVGRGAGRIGGGIADFTRGVMGQPLPVAAPPPAGGPAMGPTIAPQTDVPPGVLAPKPPVAALAPAVPSDPMLAARYNIAQALANPHINFHQAAALLGGLPRQPMPQETAQNALLYLAQQQHQQDTSADALKGLNPDQQKVAVSNATERLRRTLEAMTNAGYGALNYETQGLGIR